MSNDAWFWDIEHTASYNCLFNYIVGMRGGGKTFNFLRRSIKRFINSPKEDRKQIIYLRRHKEELKKVTTRKNATLFDDIIKEDKFPGHELKAEGDTLYCDEEVMGYAVSLSTASKLKSIPFRDVWDIVFEEFIIDNLKIYHYLPDEINKFFDLYTTIARPGHPGRHPVQVWFLGNAVTINNPYFAYFKLSMPDKGKILRFGSTKDILVENVYNAALSQNIINSRFGQLVKGSHYSDYAYRNEWLKDDTRFVEKKTRRSKYYMSLRYKDTWLGIWYDPLQMIFYISANYNREYRVQYSATTDDHMPNTMLFKQAKRTSYIKYLLDAYNAGAVRYESVKIKAMFREIVGFSW